MEWIHFQGRQLCQNCFSSLLKRTLKGKNLLPLGNKVFLSRVEAFQKVLDVK